MKLKLLTVKDLRTKKEAEVDTYIAGLRESLAELTHGLTTNKEKQTHQLRQIKKSIATALTIKSEARMNAKENT